MGPRGRRHVSGLASSSSEEEEAEAENQAALSIARRRRKRPRLLSSSSPAAGSSSSVSSCPICLGEVNPSSDSVGRPDGCSHVFCSSCIVEWSRHVDTCPIDRSRMSLIVITESDGQVRRHKVKPLRNRPEDEDNVDPLLLADTEVCEACGAGDREERLLICDRCGRLHHMECLVPALETLPRGEWFCPVCSSTASNTRAANGSASLNAAQRREVEQRGRRRSRDDDDDFDLRDFIVDDDDDDEELDDSLWEDHAFLIDNNHSGTEEANGSSWEPHSFLLRTPASANATNVNHAREEEEEQVHFEEEDEDSCDYGDDSEKETDDDEETDESEEYEDSSFVLSEAEETHVSFLDQYRLEEDESIYSNPVPGTSSGFVSRSRGGRKSSTPSSSSKRKTPRKKSVGKKKTTTKKSSSKKRTATKRNAKSTKTSTKKSSKKKVKKSSTKKQYKRKTAAKSSSKQPNKRGDISSNSNRDPSSSFSLFGSQDSLDFHGDTDLLEDSFLASPTSKTTPKATSSSASSMFSSPPSSNLVTELLASQSKTLQRTPTDILKSPETVYKRQPLPTSSFYSMNPNLSRDAFERQEYRKNTPRDERPKLLNGIEIVSAAASTSRSGNGSLAGKNQKTRSDDTSSSLSQLQSISRNTFPLKSSSSRPSLLNNDPNTSNSRRKGSSNVGAETLRRIHECLKAYELSPDVRRSLRNDCVKEFLGSPSQDIEAVVKKLVKDVS